MATVFENDARSAMGEVRDSLASVLNALGEHGSVSDLANRLGIAKTLAWRIGRVVETADPVDAISFLPGDSAATTFLRAAKRKGVPSHLIVASRNAFNAVEKMTRRHAGDRKSLELLAQGLATDTTQSEVNFRKLAYIGNSSILGLQAKTRFGAGLLYPSQSPDKVDFAVIRGFIGMKRLRKDVTCVVARSSLSDNDGSLSLVQTKRTPIDPKTADGEVPSPPCPDTEPHWSQGSDTSYP